MKDAKYYNNKFITIVFPVVGFLLLVLNFIYLKPIFAGGRFEWIVDVITIAAGVLITIGLTCLFSAYKFIKPETKMGHLGIVNLFADRDELKRCIDISKLIKKHNKIEIVGIKHSTLVSSFSKLERNIAATSNQFKLKVYFLNPDSEYRNLFEPKVYRYDNMDLANEIKACLINLASKIDANSELGEKIEIYIYDCIPIGNIMRFDKDKIFFNAYQFFQKSSDSMWMELQNKGYGATITEYYEFLKLEGSCIRIRNLGQAQSLDRENLTILYPNGASTKEILPRDEVHATGAWHRTVHIWIVTDSNEILFQRRGKNAEIDSGKWDISCAGHISAGSDNVNTALLELNEELGLIISDTELEFISTLKKNKTYKKGYIDKEFIDVYLIRKNITLNDILPNPSDVDEVHFFSSTILNDLLENDSFIFEDHVFTEHKAEYQLLANILITKQKK
jgi:isopentenyldiphosphate isomerase